MELDGVMVEALAKEFQAILEGWLSPEERSEVARRNREALAGSDCCATHDYCDANEAMMLAFQNLQEEFESDEGCAYWNEAWAKFKDNIQESWVTK